VIPLSECVKGRLYKIKSRNLLYGVFDGRDGFIGIRGKFEDEYLFREFHWETGAPHGTVSPVKDTGVDLPLSIEMNVSDGNIKLFEWLSRQTEKEASA